MIITGEQPTPLSLAGVVGSSPTELAQGIAVAHRRALVAEADVLILATAWADAHPDLDEDGQPVRAGRVSDEALAAFRGP